MEIRLKDKSEIINVSIDFIHPYIHFIQRCDNDGATISASTNCIIQDYL